MNNNGKLALSILWVVVGVALVGLSVAGVLDSSLYAGMGGALACVGVLQVVRHLRYRTDPAYRERVDTEVNDERNEFLSMKSRSLAFVAAVVVEGVGAVVAMALGSHTVQLVLSCSVGLIVAAYWISYMVLARKY
jgi:hypothetical protein